MQRSKKRQKKLEEKRKAREMRRRLKFVEEQNTTRFMIHYGGSEQK